MRIVQSINDKNYHLVPHEVGVIGRYIEYGSEEALSRGMIPVEDQADMLIPEDEWKERIQEAHLQQTMPIHYFAAQKVKPKSQGNTNYCWAYGISTALEAMMLKENQKYVRLAPATLGWLVNWRNRGFYLSETIAGAAREGIASSEFAKDGTTNKNTFKKGWQENRLKYKPHEWWDTIGKAFSKVGMMRQCVSLLLNGLPGYIAYNWWGHALAMLGVQWDESKKYNIKWLAWNSHNDGLVELDGDRGIPDEFYAVRSANFAGVEVTANCTRVAA